jgi:hypothetical protein
MSIWKELVGKTVRVRLSPEATTTWIRVVASYENGFVTFDKETISYDEGKLTLEEVY